MSDYQRFVSYLYEYQNNIKSKNCGFCRVELRDHNCRLEVHLKLPLYPFTPTLKVYVFVPSNEKLYGIFLGNASYQQGNVSGTFTFSDKNIMDSSYQFSQLGGIMIQTDSGFCFASAWKDLNIHPERFLLHENKSVEQKSFAKEFKPELSFPNSSSEITVDKSNLEPDQSDAAATSSLSAETEISIEPENAPAHNKSTAIHTEKLHTAFDTPQTAPTDSDEKINSTTEPEPALLAASMDSAPIAKESTPDNFWESILKSYPQCHPFFDDEIHNCVQLSRKDVQKISASGYPIENNAFFRHNCQSFQHFLIGKKDCTMYNNCTDNRSTHSFNNSDTNQTHYILAVPGIYNPKEQYMASMFGFPYFKCSQNSHYRNNCWGYWYRIIPEHWNDCRI